MTVQSILTITPPEALEILHSYGMNIGLQALYAGIRQGSFPFGTYIEMDRGVYYVYVAQLQKWITERLVDEEVPEIPDD